MLKNLCRIARIEEKLSNFAFGFFEICAEYRAKDCRQSCKPLAEAKKIAGSPASPLQTPEISSTVSQVSCERQKSRWEPRKPLANVKNPVGSLASPLRTPKILS